jgi:hypothetical protein
MASGDTRCWLSRVTTAPAHTMQGTPSRRAHLCARMTALRPPTALFLSRPPPLAPHAGALSSRSVCTQTRTQLTARTQRRTGVPAFARMATEDAVIVPVQLDVVLVQVGVQVVGTCPHSTHTAHAIQATCVKQFQMQATDASLNLTYPSHAVARGSSGGFACGGAILEKCCPKRGT